MLVRAGLGWGGVSVIAVGASMFTDERAGVRRKFEMCCSTRCFFRCAVVTLIFSVSMTLVLHWMSTNVDFVPVDESIIMSFGIDEDNTTVRNKKVFLQPEKNMPHPIVVWWTPFTGEQRVVRECPRGKCLFTHSRTELKNPQTAAFMFYGTDLKWNDLPLPRNPKVFWALLHEESPKNNWLFAHSDAISLFNFTSTCSRHSSYPLTTQYLHSLGKLSTPLKVPINKKSRGQGLGLISYIQSDCHPPSDRDSYVQELMKHVSVDSYGKCLHNRDFPKHLLDPLTFGTEDVLDIVAKYKFSLAMENAVCTDYITEKFWRPLEAGSVPIVRGSPTIRDWAPDVNASIIVASDFSSPKELADYLLYLDTHSEEYEKFLLWKQAGITNERLLNHMNEREWHINEWDKLNFIDGFECFVCDQVHETKERIRRGEKTGPFIATQDHYSCPLPEPALLGTTELKQYYRNINSELQFWRFTAKCSELQARAIFPIIHDGGTPEEVAGAFKEACRHLDYRNV